MGLLQVMLIAMGLFFGTENTQGSVNKNNANEEAKLNANYHSGFYVGPPTEVPCDPCAPED